MKGIFTSLLILATSFSLFSQDAPFFKEYGETGVFESGTGIVQLPSGSVFISGIESNGVGESNDVLVIKFNSEGEALDKWTFGTAENEYANSLQLVDNELVIIGESSDLTGTKKSGFILRVDTLGNELYFESFKKQDTNLTFSDGFFDGKNYLVTGFVNGAGFGNDVYVAQISDDLDENWEYVFGDSLNEVGNSIKEFSNGTVVITCDNQRTDWSYNVLALCFDKKGNLLWENDVANRFNGGSKKMLINAAGNAFMFGEMSTPSAPFFDMYFAEISPAGELIQAGWVPGSDAHSDAVFGGCEVSPGQYLFTGFGYNSETDQTDIPVVSINSTGELIEQKFYGADLFDIGYAITPALSGGFLMTGNSYYGSDVQLTFVHDYISMVLNSNDISNAKERIINAVFKTGSGTTVRLNDFYDLKKVQLFDTNGKVAFFENTNSITNEISFSNNLSSGIYFLKFELKNGEMATERVFIW